jgi:hypothetical protein
MSWIICRKNDVVLSVKMNGSIVDQKVYKVKERLSLRF